MNWSINNKAHTTVYSVAAYFRKKRGGSGYTFIPFKNAGSWKVKELYDETINESNSISQSKAKKTAAIYDEFFESFYGAKLEENIEKLDAMEAMFTCLIDGNKTITDFASIVDENYRFAGELDQ
jgi:hypothetical protein